jgi:hypothetical protein
VGKDVEIKFHPLISECMPDPEHPLDAVVLEGYLGPSKRGEEYVRFYFDLDFQCCCEIPRDGIIYSEPPDSANEAKPKKIVIKSCVKLDLIHTVEASYLKGTIASAYSGGAKTLVSPFTHKKCVEAGIPVTKLPCTAIISIINLCETALIGICQ